LASNSFAIAEDEVQLDSVDGDVESNNENNNNSEYIDI